MQDTYLLLVEMFCSVVLVSSITVFLPEGNTAAQCQYMVSASKKNILEVFIMWIACLLTEYNGIVNYSPLEIDPHERE